MRGQRLFKTNFKPITTTKVAKKGRSTTLIEQRNECLMARYYYFSKHLKMSYEEIIEKMVQEFYLSPERITRLIYENNAILQVYKKETTIKSLRTKWQHFKWN